MDVIVVLVIVLVVVLVWRGPRVLPKWGETLGRGVRATRHEIADIQDEARPKDGGGTPTA